MRAPPKNKPEINDAVVPRMRPTTDELGSLGGGSGASGVEAPPKNGPAAAEELVGPSCGGTGCGCTAAPLNDGGTTARFLASLGGCSGSSPSNGSVDSFKHVWLLQPVQLQPARLLPSMQPIFGCYATRNNRSLVVT